VILGEDPITKQKVAFNGTNVLNAILALGGEEGDNMRTKMNETGTFQKVAAYIDEGIFVFGNLYDTIVQNFSHIWDLVTIHALMNPRATFDVIYLIFIDPVNKVLAFAKKVGVEILKFIKEVLTQQLSAWAKAQRGYSLVTVLIGKDPFTDEVIPFTTENVIKGFFGLMEGGEEQYNHLKESGAIDRTVAKINAAVKKLNMTPAAIVQLFIDLWNSFSIADLMDPFGAFRRILDKFGEPIGRLIDFVIEIVKIIVEAVLIVMNFPFDLIHNIIAKAMQAFELIKKNPVRFLKNLLRAIKEGFMQFFERILTHLFNGLKEWFLGEVEAAGIPIPTDFTVMGIIKWLLAVLDITMEKIWKKLEERIGKPKVEKIKKMIDMAERVASAAGEAYEFMQDVQKRGFMAVMVDKMKEQLSNIWEMVLDAVKSFVMDQIINKMVTKLLSMLDPTGIMAVVNSAIALYKAIQSAIKYIRKMLEIVNSFVEGTLQIAQGQTKNAANFLEGALARGVPVVIGFLANQVGLNLSERLKEALEIVRDKVDKGLTWVIDKIVTFVEKLVNMATGGNNEGAEEGAPAGQFERSLNFGGEGHSIKIRTEGQYEVLMASSEFTELHNQLAQLRRVYVEPNEQGVGGHLAKTNQQEAKNQLDTKLREIARRKAAILNEAQAQQSNAQKRDQILTDGIDELKNMVEEMSTYMLETFNVAFGGATDAAVNDIVYVMEAGKGYKVLDIRAIQNGHFGIKTQSLDHVDNKFLNYEDHEKTWKKAPTNAPPHSGGFTGSAGTGTRKAVNLQKGVANGGTPSHDPPGYGGAYNRRGHLVANVFGGPGDRRNIVAMTYRANHTNDGIVSIETEVRSEIAKGTVVNYSATPNYGSKNWSTDPPDSITVSVDEVWPNPKSGIYYKDVSNT
jgi:hypothetical protein